MAEAGFETMEALDAFPTRDFALREITNDPRFTGGGLVEHGLPQIR